MQELASSSSCSADEHEHTDSLCEEFLRNTNHITGLPFYSALRVFTVPQLKKAMGPKGHQKWIQHKFTCTSKPNHIAFSLNLDHVWLVPLTSLAPKGAKLVQWMEPTTWEQFKHRFDFPWLSIAVARQGKCHLSPPYPTCLWLVMYKTERMTNM